MSGNVWMFSDQIDDEDLEFLAREFVTYTMSIDAKAWCYIGSVIACGIVLSKLMSIR